MAEIREPAIESKTVTNSSANSVAIIASSSNSLATALLDELRKFQQDRNWHLCDTRFCSQDAVRIFIPSSTTRDGLIPNLAEARPVFEKAAAEGCGQFVLLSSALVYGTGPGRQHLVDEEYFSLRNASRISGAWNSLESLAQQTLDGLALTILRPAITLGSPTLFSRLLSRRFVLSLPGHDPSLQLLSLSDLAAAVVCVIKANKPGIFNVAPDGVVPMHAAIRLSGGVRVPIPRTLRRIIIGTEALEFCRYSWTVSNAKIKEQLGFTPRRSSAAALLEFRGRKLDSEPEFDEFGMDKGYIRFYGESVFKFLSQYYWRVESRGMEHIPLQGRAILAGMHRGFMPWDGVMALHTVVRATGRYPRFLTHPGLLKFPFIANFITKLGGVIASQESADRVLGSGELLGIFPEGIQGAFTLYRNAYKLHAFGRDAFVKLALRHRAPIIPFVTVGSAETFPVFARIKSRRWTHYSSWPCIPITPTFPLLPVPLPSKWHTLFLPPISVDQYPPEAAEDGEVVKAISLEVRTKMQQALDEILSRRRSIFFGSVFERNSRRAQKKPGAV